MLDVLFKGWRLLLSLGVLYGGLGISKLQFFIKKNIRFLSNFWSSKVKTLDPDRIRFGIHPKMLDPDPDPMNPDPTHWFLEFTERKKKLTICSRGRGGCGGRRGDSWPPWRGAWVCPSSACPSDPAQPARTSAPGSGHPWSSAPSRPQGAPSVERGLVTHGPNIYKDTKP